MRRLRPRVRSALLALALGGGVPLAAQAIGQGFELERQGRLSDAATVYLTTLRAEPANLAALLGLERVLPGLGRLAELATSEDLYEIPLHPYTQALLSAIPVPDPEVEARRKRIILEGDVPSPVDPPTGCNFHPRCWKAQQVCREVIPPLEAKRPNHYAACHFPG